MMKLLAELKRRQMFRVAAAYAVVAWLILQVVNNLAPGLNLPNWAITLVIVLLGAGFPVALLFCWIQQLAPGDGAQAQVKVNRLDWILAGGLAAVIALLLYQQLAPSGAPVAQDKAGNESTAQAPAPSGVSIAVLPFANVSGDASRDFFSDGMTDEISGALAQIADLRVIARSSAFQFKGQNQDVRAVGQALGATHLIDGSVRQAGNRVRITAQLVRAGDGVQLWSENYDRELTDIFAIQEDIARAIAGALRVPLGLAQGESIVSNRTKDLDSYQEYLRARSLFRARAIADVVATLEPVVARDPNYAPAWALLADAYTFVPTYSGETWIGSVQVARQLAQSSLDKGERAAREAIRLDPEHGGGYMGLGQAEAFRPGKWAAAEALFKQALALDPDDTETLDAYSQMLVNSGYVSESLRLRVRMRTLEPSVPIYNLITADIMGLAGQHDAAIRIFEAQPPDPNGVRNAFLARAFAVQRRYNDAADTVLAIPPSMFATRRAIDDTARLLRVVAAGARPPEAVPDLEGNVWAYFHLGVPERALENPERAVAAAYMGRVALSYLWDPLAAPLRRTERFKSIVRAIGLPDYWRARGWPDKCRPVGADDFVCD
jgi:TolB-like protein